MSAIGAVAEESSSSAEQVSASTEQTSASAQDIVASARELSATAARLEQLAAQFELYESSAAAHVAPSERPAVERGRVLDVGGSGDARELVERRRLRGQ